MKSAGGGVKAAGAVDKVSPAKISLVDKGNSAVHDATA
jgi:hypothetical protein